MMVTVCAWAPWVQQARKVLQGFPQQLVCGGVQGKGWTAREVVASVEEGEGALCFSRLTLPALRFAFYSWSENISGRTLLSNYMEGQCGSSVMPLKETKQPSKAWSSAFPPAW